MMMMMMTNLPSNNSRLAPPPVLTWLTLSSVPYLAQQVAVSPPPKNLKLYCEESCPETYGHWTSQISLHKRLHTHQNMCSIYLAIRWGFPLSRMTTNNFISPMKFCYNTTFTFQNNPKDLDSDRSRSLGLILKEKKKLHLTAEKIC